MPRDLYDDLDPLYREIWGTSLHHGCWESGAETTAEAKNLLVQKTLIFLRPHGHALDIGCGYGVLSHQLVSQFNCKVTACTSSAKQAEKIASHPRLTLLSGDWLQQKVKAESLDCAVAIESASHFADLDAFFAKTAAALEFDARFVLADWYSPCGDKALLRHLAQLGNLPGWRSFETFLETAARHGFIVRNRENLSHQVAPTWSALFWKSLLLPFQKPRLIPTILTQLLKKPALLWGFPFLRLAYHLGGLEYHLVAFEKADAPAP